MLRLSMANLSRQEVVEDLGREAERGGHADAGGDRDDTGSVDRRSDEEVAGSGRIDALPSLLDVEALNTQQAADLAQDQVIELLTAEGVDGAARSDGCRRSEDRRRGVA